MIKKTKAPEKSKLFGVQSRGEMTMKKLMIVALLVDKPSDTASAQTETAEVSFISPVDTKALMESEDVLLLDVRTQEEYAEAHIEGAKLLPYDEISERTDELPADKDMAIIVYCRSGSRAATAGRTLVGLGYTQVYNLGGISSWPYGTVSGD
jgi:rhodanese-related sulfurtransferase